MCVKLAQPAHGVMEQTVISVLLELMPMPVHQVAQVVRLEHIQVLVPQVAQNVRLEDIPLVEHQVAVIVLQQVMEHGVEIVER